MTKYELTMPNGFILFNIPNPSSSYLSGIVYWIISTTLNSHNFLEISHFFFKGITQRTNVFSTFYLSFI